MAQAVTNDLRLRRVLGCISERYMSAGEIAGIHSQKYPPGIETMVQLLNKVRRKVFKEKNLKKVVRSVESELAKLEKLGYVNSILADFHREELPYKIKLYCLSNLGRDALNPSK